MTGAATVEGTVVVLTGEVDLAVTDQVEAAIERALQLRADVLELDLSALTFIDSAGLGIVARAVRQVDAVRLLRTPASIARVVELAGLASVVEVVHD